MNTLISTAATAATLEAIRIMVAVGGLGKDAGFLASAAKRTELTPHQAILLRKFLHRYASLVPADLLASALSDEPDPPGQPVRRAPGRPRIGVEPLSAAERSRRRRATGRLATAELPVSLVERLRTLRDARGLSMAALVEAALDLFEKSR